MDALFVRPETGPAAGWRWPLAGQPRVVRGFDPPQTVYGAGHRGVDLAALPGAPVLAAGPGLVAYAGNLAGRGVISIQHADGLRTTYEPVQPTVRVGARVAAGALIGRLVAGHLGCPVVACLHWGVRRGDAYLNPLDLIQQGPVRLLPLTDPLPAPPPPTAPGVAASAKDASPAGPSARAALGATGLLVGSVLFLRRRSGP
jgi:murein DD-endopeptidase MepM/ murein hydrolase activator NlpD